jgi:hypothetical protein
LAGFFDAVLRLVVERRFLVVLIPRNFDAGVRGPLPAERRAPDRPP